MTDQTIDAAGVLALLDEAGIDYHVLRHKPLMTVEDARSIRTELEGDEGQIKNLFLKNKKGDMWLLTCHESRNLDLKQVARALGARRFSFGSPERLMQYLGVRPGAVSPLGLVNDFQAEVSFYLDETLLSHEVIHVHPLDNAQTVSLRRVDLVRFLEGRGHRINILPLELPVDPPAGSG